jgi:hypothetical protein
MCRSSSATEETSSGGHKVDSVVLRIMTQQDDCICRVTLVAGERKLWVYDFFFKFTICNDALPRIIRMQKPLIKSNHTPSEIPNPNRDKMSIRTQDGLSYEMFGKVHVYFESE